jgi:rhodanese-related sulfurtransferase
MSISIASAALYEQLGLPESYVVIDVRIVADVLATPRLIPGALRADPEGIKEWARTFRQTRRLVVYCSEGGARSHEAANSLTALGYRTSILEGGIQAWIAAGYATTKVRTDLHAPGGSRWVTRERPKIDRLACPWLVRRFIDPDAAFFYTPAHQVRAEAETLNAQPYDIADVTFSHRGARCSFDAFLDEFDLHDPIVDKVADIVRSADTGELAQSREAPGLLAISLGLSANIGDDLVLLEHAMPIYDALYTWCKKAHAETHSWPQKTRQ